MYFGSVRFFRHLIITIVLLVFLLPAVGAGALGFAYTRTHKELAQAQAALEGYASEQHELKDAVDELEQHVYSRMDALRRQLDHADLGQERMRQEVQFLEDTIIEFRQSANAASYTEPEK